jgi:hypothetical protein
MDFYHKMEILLWGRNWIIGHISCEISSLEESNKSLSVWVFPITSNVIVKHNIFHKFCILYDGEFQYAKILMASLSSHFFTLKT